MLIIDELERYVRLQYVLFYDKEDLGDQIFCVGEGQTIWVAKYFSEHFIKEEVIIE